MLHLQTIVSRKTPLDGRLEIPESLAGRLASAKAPLRVSLVGIEAPAQLEEMTCTCAKGAGDNHRHHFLVAEALKGLSGGANINLAVDVDEGLIRIESAQ